MVESCTGEVLDFTLDQAKARLGVYLPAGKDLKAKLEWTHEDGWVLSFKDDSSEEPHAKLRFHRERSIQDHSWPGRYRLSVLAKRSGQWPDTPRRGLPILEQKTWLR